MMDQNLVTKSQDWIFICCQSKAEAPVFCSYSQMRRFESWNMKFKNKMLFQDIVLHKFQMTIEGQKIKMFVDELDSVEKDCCRISDLDRFTPKSKKSLCGFKGQSSEADEWSSD